MSGHDLDRKATTRALRRAAAAKAAAGGLRFPEAVAELRTAVDMGRVEFARVTGLAEQQVADLEAGDMNQPLETLARIGRVFGFVIGLVPRTETEEGRR